MRKDKQLYDCIPAELIECAILKLMGGKEQFDTPESAEVAVEIEQLASLLEVAGREFERIGAEAKQYGLDVHDAGIWKRW